MKHYCMVFGLLCIMVFFLPLKGFAQCPGITQNTIKLGAILPLSGAIANYGQSNVAVDQAIWKDVNERGGIGGRKVELIMEDSQYLPNKGVAAYLKLVHQDGVFAVTNFGAAVGGAIFSMAERDKVPFYQQSPTRMMWDPPQKYTFCWLSSFEVQFGNLLMWYADKIGKKQKARVGIIYQDDDYGKGGVKGYQMATKMAGYEVVASAACGRTDVDLSAHVLQMRKANVDLLGLVVNTKAAAFVINEARKMGMNVPIFNHADDDVLPLLNKPYGELYGDWFSVLWHERDKVPGLKKLKALFDKYKINVEGFPGFQFSFRSSITLTAVEALKRMFASGDISRDGFVKATESIRDWDCEGMSVITFGPDRRLGSDSVAIYKADDITGTWEREPTSSWFRYVNWKE